MRRRTKLITAGAVVLGLAAAGGGIAAANAVAGGDDEPLTGEALERATAAALEHVGEGRVTETEARDDDGDLYEVEVTRDDGTQVDVHLDRDFRVVWVEDEGIDDDRDELDDDRDDDRDDVPLTPEELEQATAAALAHTGGGRVVEAERDTGDAAYEVEVRLEDGREVEIDLDEAFNVLRADAGRGDGDDLDLEPGDDDD